MKKVLIGFFLLIVAIIATDRLLLPWYTESGQQTTVPDVRSMSFDEAVRALGKTNLRAMKSYNVRYLPDVPSDRVIDQIPEPGSVVKPGRNVFLVLNRTDKPVYPMPELTGRTEEEARQELGRIGMVISAVQYLAVSVPDQHGRVLSQSVPPEVMLRSGNQVSFIVGKLEQEPSGLMRVVVPDLLGMSLEQASGIILRNGLAVGNTRYEHSQLLVPETVISQKPAPNAMVRSGSPVDLTVATDDASR